MPLWTAGASRRELFHGPPYPVDTSDPHDHQVWCELVWKWENGDVYLDSRGWSNCQVNTCVLDFGTSVIHSVQKTEISHWLGLFIYGKTKWNEIKIPSNWKIVKKYLFLVSLLQQPNQVTKVFHRPIFADLVTSTICLHFIPGAVWSSRPPSSSSPHAGDAPWAPDYLYLRRRG